MPERMSARIADKKIRDCNGDLHMEHICIGDTITIFDCIEFNERFRYSDTASDIAFLAMDLEYHNEYALSRALIDSYVRYSRDMDLHGVLTFYKIYRAYVRGKVLCFLTDDEHVTMQEKESALGRARRYFELAASYVRDAKTGGEEMREPFLSFMKSELDPSTLIITCGLPGSWKTETAQEIERIMRFPILRTDLVRLEVLKSEDVFDEKVASDMGKRRRVYDEVFRRAEEMAQKSDGLILDATFITQELRRRAAEIAERHGKTFAIMETRCPQEVSIARILRRTRENYESNALTEQAYHNNRTKFEPIDLDDLKRLHPQLRIMHYVVDTTEDPPEGWYVIGREKR
jgi:predicted kinase